MTSPVAIVGIGCRLPRANGPGGFWRMLCEGIDAIREVPRERWAADELYDRDPSTPGKMNTRWGGFLDDVSGFDADFFGISPREAERMDPQQRIGLEVASEALEDSGTAASGLAGSDTGVFMGVSTYDHGAALTVTPGELEAYDATGSALSIVANRLSYSLNLRGPSIVLDTACSSSLVAIHLACQALDRGEAEVAIAGGVNVITNPWIALSFSKGGLMSPDGRCKSFDHRANGYVRSEGAGVVVLKPLACALEDGDRIYSVILGGAVKQDGRTNGLTAPSRLAQEDVLRVAYRAAGVDPAAVDYVEAHGTGTPVGDPIEGAALASVFGAGRPPDRPLRIGSAKSNIGHLEAAAGVTGLIKLSLALHHRRLPPSLHFERPNSMLDLDRLPLVIQRRLEPWPACERPPVGGVSSFGFGGTNAHLVLSAAPAPTERRPAHAGYLPQLVPISTRSEATLLRRAAAWSQAAHAHAGEREWLPAAAAAAALRTDHHEHRAAVVAADAAELVAGMTALADGERASVACGPSGAVRRPPRTVFVFPGQGSQWAGMGRRLAQTVPAFREAIRRCDKAIARWLGHSLWSAEAGLMAAGTANVQPAVFAVQVALAETWRAWGVKPAAVVGHSMGEIAAAHVAGALSLDDAARVVCERSRLLSEISGAGGLALVELGIEAARELISGREDALSVAAANSPRATVLSGSPEALDDTVALLSGRGVFARRIAVEFAAHSHEVEPLLPRLRAALQGLTPREEEIPLYSTVTGGPLNGARLGPEYWETNLRAPVLFAPALARLLADRHDAFVEVAPHPVLSRSVVEIAAEAGREATVIPSMRRDEDEFAAMLAAVGKLYSIGARVDWRALYPHGAAHVTLPPHGWEHRGFPVPGGLTASRPVATPSVPRPSGANRSERNLLGVRIRVGAEPALRLWPLRADLASAPELADHVVEGLSIVPGAYWLTAAAEAASRSVVTRQAVLEGVTFAYPCPLSEAANPGLQLALRPTREGKLRFNIASWAPAGNAVTHAEGTLRASVGGDAPPRAPLEDLTARCTVSVSVDEHYARLERAGLRYGPRFRGLVELRAGEREAVARVRLPDQLADSLPLHPALLDACLHTVAAAAGEVADDALPLPAGVELVWARRDVEPLREGWCHARVLQTGERELVAEVTVLGDAGDPVWAAAGLHVRLAAPRRSLEEGRVYGLRWEPAEVEPVATGPAATGPAGWLVLGDNGGVGRALAHRLAADGDRFLLTVPGPAAGPQERSLASDDPSAYASLLDEAESYGLALRGVIDARAVTGDRDAPGDEALHGVAAGALQLAQTLTERSRRTVTPRLWLLTTATQALGTAANAATLAGATLWGFGRTLANEMPDVGCSLVDLDSPVGEYDIEAVASALRADEPPAQVVVREGCLFQPRLVPMAGRSAAQALRARPDRTYLITGGLGALGLHMAGQLVARGARHLLLVGRSAPSAEAERALNQLRETGAEVRVARADVADVDQVERVLAELEARPYPLAGVVHAAGVLEDALVTDLRKDALRRTLRGKALGAWNLHRLTRDQPIELFVLTSSLAGLIGSPGQAAYAAANTFLDALAQHRVALGLPALSIAWGPWHRSGLAVASGGAERLAARGVRPLDPAVALNLLDDCVSTGRPQLAAAAFDFGELRQTAVGPAARQLLADLMPEPEDEAPERGVVGAAIRAEGSLAERERAMLSFVVAQVAEVLSVPQPDVTATVPFQELGLDSLMAIELRDRLEAALAVSLSAALLFAHPTAESLARALIERLTPGAVAASAGSDAAGLLEAATGDELSELGEEELAALVAGELDLLNGMEGAR